MLWNASALHGYSIDATDGTLGSASDLLFADDNWRIRWLVVDTGHWLPGRKILLHPSALGRPDAALRRLPVKLTKAQVRDGPTISADEPVSQQMQAHLYDYYGWDPSWTITHSGRASPLVGQPYHARLEPQDRGTAGSLPEGGDPRLRSIAAITGYHIRAIDGEIGHVEDLLVEDVGWDIWYLVVDTRNWWPGNKVLIAPRAIGEIDWSGRLVRLEVGRQNVRDSPAYDPSSTSDGAFDATFLKYYGVKWVQP